MPSGRSFDADGHGPAAMHWNRAADVSVDSQYTPLGPADVHLLQFADIGRSVVMPASTPAAKTTTTTSSGRYRSSRDGRVASPDKGLRSFRSQQLSTISARPSAASAASPASIVGGILRSHGVRNATLADVGVAVEDVAALESIAAGEYLVLFEGSGFGRRGPAPRQLFFALAAHHSNGGLLTARLHAHPLSERVASWSLRWLVGVTRDVSPAPYTEHRVARNGHCGVASAEVVPLCPHPQQSSADELAAYQQLQLAYLGGLKANVVGLRGQLLPSTGKHALLHADNALCCWFYTDEGAAQVVPLCAPSAAAAEAWFVALAAIVRANDTFMRSRPVPTSCPARHCMARHLLEGQWLSGILLSETLNKL